MAHPCYICDSECYCNGSLDDVVTDETPSNCKSCGCENDIPFFDDDQFDDEDFVTPPENDDEDERNHCDDYLETWIDKEDPNLL